MDKYYSIFEIKPSQSDKHEGLESYIAQSHDKDT